MNENISVTIIIPAYNAAQYLNKTIQSVIDQTFTDWELLIIDDGSTDNTEETVAPFLTDERIQYIKRENFGVPFVRNYGIRMAKGPLMAFLDADDIWLPSKLEKQLAIFQKYPDVGVCGTSTWQINPQGEVFGKHIRKEFHGQATTKLLTGEVAIGMSTSITRKEVYEKIGYFDEGFLPFTMDYDFWLRASLEFNFYVIEEPLVNYRSGHTSISSQGANKRRELIQNIVIPRFLNEYGGSKYVKWYHIRKLYADCHYGRAASAQSLKTRWYWIARALLCYPVHRDTLRMVFRMFFPKKSKPQDSL